MRFHKIAIVFFIISLFLYPSIFAQQIPQKKVLTIDECIRIALRNSYSVRVAEQTYDEAKWQLLGAWSGFLPQADLSLNWSTSDVPIWQDFGGERFASSSARYSLGFSISQNLFDGGRNLATYNIAHSYKKAAEEGLKIARLNTILAVKENCYGLLKAEMLYEVQKEAVKRSEEQMSLAKARFDLGSASLSDYLKAKVQLVNDSLSLITYQNSVRSAQENLNYILRIDLNTLIEVSAKLEHEEFEKNLDQLMKRTLPNHPQMSQAKTAVNIARSSVTRARSYRFPSLTFGVGYDWRDTKFPDSWNKYTKVNDPWSWGFRVGLNIFDGLSITSGIRSAKAALRKEEENFEQTKKDLELEIRQAFLKVEEAEKKIQVTEDALEAAEQDLKLTQEKYNLGAASMLELLDANVSYKTVKNNQVEALYDYSLAVARFEKAIGK